VRGWGEEGEQEAYNRTLVWKHVVVHTCFNKTTKFTASGALLHRGPVRGWGEEEEQEV